MLGLSAQFCAIKEWNGDFCKLGTNEGFVTPGNNKVEADGLYTIIVDLLGNKVTVMPAEIYGMGPCFGDDKDWYVVCFISKKFCICFIE